MLDVTLEQVRQGLRDARYVTTPRVETALFLALALEKPLLAEGPAGAGKTELGKVLAAMLRDRSRPPAVLRGARRGARALRVELPEAAPAHPGRSRRGPAVGGRRARHLLARVPARAAAAARHHGAAPRRAADRRDRQGRPGVRGVPARGAERLPGERARARHDPRRAHRPVVVLTSNRTRDLSEALLRRCLHLFVDFPGAGEGSGDHRAQGARARRAAARRRWRASSPGCASST